MGDVLFHVAGKPVRYGDTLYVSPRWHRNAGAVVTAHRRPKGKATEVMVRSSNGAVPIVPMRSLSWSPHPETLELEDMKTAGVRRPTVAQIEAWRAALASDSCLRY